MTGAVPRGTYGVSGIIAYLKREPLVSYFLLDVRIILLFLYR